MRTVGLIGGTGWPATRDYYELLNRRAQAARGGLDSLELRIWSFDFGALLARGQRDPAAFDGAFAQAADGLLAMGAQVLAIASATGHLFAPPQADSRFVLLPHSCGQALAGAGVRRVGVLATARTHGAGLFERAFGALGIEAVAPAPPQIEAVDAAIFGELETGRPGPLTERALRTALEGFTAQGVEHVLLACTELRPAVLEALGLAPAQRVWDATALHAEQILRVAGLEAKDKDN